MKEIRLTIYGVGDMTSNLNTRNMLTKHRDRNMLLPSHCDYEMHIYQHHIAKTSKPSFFKPL